MMDTPASHRLKGSPIEQSSMMQLVIDFFIFVVLFVLPWFISTLLKEVFNTPKNALLGFVAVAMVAALAIDCAVRRRVDLPRSLPFLFFTLLVGWMGVSCLWSGSWMLASRDLGYHVALWAIFSVTVISVSSRERIENLLHFAIAGGVIAAGYATLQYWQFDLRVFPALSRVLYHDDGGPGGLLTLVFNPENARWLHSWLDPQFLVLPDKPEEASKSYSFMGHRNYLAGYLIALIPLVMSRLIAHLDVLFKRLRDESERREILPALMITGGVLGFAMVTAMASLFYPPLKVLTVMAVGAAGLVPALHPAMRGPMVYTLSLLLMFATVMQTHTRGAWIGLGLGMPVLILLIWAKDVGSSLSRSRSIELVVRFGLLAGSFLIWIKFIGVSLSWVPFFAVLGESILYYCFYGFRPRFLHRGALIGSVVPLALLVLALNWKTTTLLGKEVVNPLNKEATSATARLTDTFAFKGGTSTHQRMLIYLTTLRIITDRWGHFLIGTGIGSYGLHYMPFQNKVLGDPEGAHWLVDLFASTVTFLSKGKFEPAYESYKGDVNKSVYAHDEYLHYWSELGLIGLCLFVALMISLFAGVLDNIRDMTLDYDSLLYIGIISSLLSVMGHIFFSFCLHLAYTASLFWIMVAFAIRFFPVGILTFSLRPRTVLHHGEGEASIEVGLEEGPYGIVHAWVLREGPPRDPDAKDSELKVRILDPDGTTHQGEGPTKIRTETWTDDRNREREASITELKIPATAGTWKARFTVPGANIPEQVIEVTPSAPWLVPAASAAVIVLSLYPMLCVGRLLWSEHHWRNAFVLFKRGQFENSMTEFVKSLEFDPKKGEILFDFGRALMDSQRNRDAIHIFEKATVNFVDPANFHNIALCQFKEAGRLRGEGKIAESDKAMAATEKAYRDALGLNIIYEQSLSNLIFLLYEKATDLELSLEGKSPEQASAILEKVRSVTLEAEELARQGAFYYRWNPAFHMALGLILSRQGGSKLGEARSPLFKSIDLMLLDKLRAEINPLKHDHARTLETLARAKVGEETAVLQKQAADLAQKLARYEKAFEEGHRLYWRESRFEEAWKVLDSVENRSLDHNGDKARLNLALILYTQGEPEKAIHIAKGVGARNDPGNRQRFYTLVTSHYENKVKAGKATPEDMVEFAKSLREWGFAREAVQVAYGLLDQDPTHKVMLRILADCLRDQRYWNEALGEYRRLQSLLTTPEEKEVAADVAVQIDRMLTEASRTPTTSMQMQFQPQAPPPAPQAPPAPLEPDYVTRRTTSP